jgi:hypothetical protein
MTALAYLEQIAQRIAETGARDRLESLAATIHQQVSWAEQLGWKDLTREQGAVFRQLERETMLLAYPLCRSHAQGGVMPWPPEKA